MSKLIEETEELPRLTPLGKNWMEEDSEGYYLNREYVLEIIKRHEAQDKTDALCDLSYAAGAKAGWNCAASGDAIGMEKIMERSPEAVKELRRINTTLPPLDVQDAQIALDAARYRKFKRLHEQPDAPLHGECAAEINRLQEQVRVLREALLNVAESDIPEPCWCGPRYKKEFPNVPHAAYCVNATKALSVTPDHVVDGVQHDDYPVDGWSEK